LILQEAIDTYTERISEAVLTAIGKSTLWAKPSIYAKDFWTRECSEAVTKARYCRSEWINKRTNELWQRYLKATDAKGKVIQKAKKACFRQQIHEASYTQ